MTPYLAQIMQVGFNFAPPDWMQAAGQTMGISQNTALFSLLGTTFGGNGTTNFQLPNVMSRAIVGVGQSAGLSNYVWGQQGGMEQVTLNVTQMPTHTHIATVTPPTGTLQALSGVTQGSQGNSPTANAKLANTYDATNHTTPGIYAPAGTAGTAVNLAGVTVSGGTVTNSLTGGNVPVQILPPYLALWTLIAVSGIFPSRS